MPSLKDIRNRIGSVKNTKKITSAMKLVAAAKLRRAQQAVEAARPYAEKMREVVGDLSARVDADAHPLLERPETEPRALIIVVTSDRGLAGGFNANLLRALDRFIAERSKVHDAFEILTVGRKGAVHFKRHAIAAIAEDFPGVIGAIDIAGVQRIARRAMGEFANGEADRVYLAYNEFISAIQINPIIKPLLPFSVPEGGGEAAVGGGEEYIYEPSEEALLSQLLPNAVEIEIFQALLESAAAEQGSRMTAMDNATTNAEEMIDGLTLQYNRARQAYITKELVEIVSGAESLKG